MQIWQLDADQERLSDLNEFPANKRPQDNIEHSQSIAAAVSRAWLNQCLDLIDDKDLLSIVKKRLSQWQDQPDQVLEMSRHEIERIARGLP